MKRPFLFISFLVTALALSGCGDLNKPPDNAQTGALKVTITIPDNAGMSAQFLDDIELDKVYVVLTQGDTELDGEGEIENNQAEVLFPDIDPGEWTVTAEVKDTDGYSIYDGEDVGTVTAGAVTTVPLSMTLTHGNLVVNVIKPDNEVSDTVDWGTVVLSGLQDPIGTVEISGGNYTATFTDLVPAVRMLTVTLNNASGKRVAFGEQAVAVLPGRTTTANAAANSTIGKLDITATWQLPPTGPTLLDVTRQGDDVVLTWAAPTNGNIAGYIVLRAEDEDDIKRPLAKLTPDTTSYTDDEITNSGTYWYWVVAEDAEGFTSIYGEPLSIQVTL